MTGRAVIAALCIMLSMEKIYTKSYNKEEKQKRYIKNSYSSFLHFLTINDIRNEIQCQ